jgi:GNAT superfamily N-acetyltransferase
LETSIAVTRAQHLPPTPELAFHPRSEGESWEAITDLLHRAYASLAAGGLRYVASHQAAEVTERRAGNGECWVGLLGERLVATATLVRPGRGHGPALYGEPGVAKLEQFCVAPELQGRGIASALLSTLEARARAWGARRLALDTAAATHLIAWYTRRGFQEVGAHDWRPHVNYLSVVLAKELDAEA